MVATNLSWAQLLTAGNEPFVVLPIIFVLQRNSLIYGVQMSPEMASVVYNAHLRKTWKIFSNVVWAAVFHKYVIQTYDLTTVEAIVPRCLLTVVNRN